ncbi:RAMP superfamily protein [Vacuolonema iberomarrocanum]|uniref:RAMP superfamily protein n=1 Tax=Vacuolonema iberomarrocanum TaxID=3454632 RepID=UPI0019E29BC8|nr:RAMP superfamily protein [filamentous cyanobacterium LEGE 07170]
MIWLPDAAQKVPMMFRAQINGRCQVQRLIPRAYEQDAERWAIEWIDKTYPFAPTFSDGVQTRTYQLSWRFVTNSGQDDGVIRPVIGARGWPFYPGSSMKGVFRQVCDAAQAERYCGGEDDLSPGILRFHGGYPTTDAWTENLVDLVHPQQDRQVKQEQRTSANIQISLYKPELVFGISSIIPLSADEWDTIWHLWERAIAQGLGCRVSAGYGQPQAQSGNVLYAARLKGQGQASKRLDDSGEFRPNIFRAAMRGHALRIFGGLTDAITAESLVDTLFGGIRRHNTKVGLLSMAFQAEEDKLVIGSFGRGGYTQPTYKVQGQLLWMLTRSLPDEQKTALTKLIEALTRFAMVFGGFGKSWRRADHRLVYPDYYDAGDKALIGCHWEWLDKRSQIRDVRVRKLDKVADFIEEVRTAAQNWMQLQGIEPQPENHADWREAWHPSKVEVWGRMTRKGDGIEDSLAVSWLHDPYRDAIPTAGVTQGSIYQSTLTGQMGRIGRLWHRMYPYIRLVDDPKNPGKPKPLTTTQYFELLTLFPDDAAETIEFLDFLDNQQRSFQRLWPR